MKKNKRKPLLRYWTVRYLITLIIGLAVIAIVTGIIIRQTTLKSNLDINKYLAEEIASRVLEETVGASIYTEKDPEYFKGREKLMDLSGNPSLYVADANGNVLSHYLTNQQVAITKFPKSLLNHKGDVKKVEGMDGRNYYLVKRPIAFDDTVMGWAVVVQQEAELTNVNHEYKLLTLMIISVSLLGWAAIYFLSKQLVKPIQKVAQAAKQVQEGNYEVEISEAVREEEVYDLVHSFKEMAGKLEQLESLRAELLAGVTHELKTPVTSISGLLQAINDGVVTGEEAKEFLAISLQETERMQKMVGDLLEFNSFSANAISVTKDIHNIRELMNEIVYQWRMVREKDSFSIEVTETEDEYFVMVDSLRLQQIMINLLNNASQAIKEEGKIIISIYLADSKTVSIDVTDNGIGIPPEEQELIFERFYRGEEKKFHVRGLGLGLPLSKMLAKAMDGDLVLKHTSKQGTTFTITLPRDTKS